MCAPGIGEARVQMVAARWSELAATSVAVKSLSRDGGHRVLRLALNGWSAIVHFRLRRWARRYACPLCLLAASCTVEPMFATVG